ncbi:MAG TPA: hypothetical protein VG755_05645 [Nannocystaceae bacterium]|nr:hypothetical protein [Nannocystaceae bacterium]
MSWSQESRGPFGVPELDPAAVAHVRRLCEAIVESARIGLDPAMLVESLNDCTANDFTADDVLGAAAELGSETLACLAISPPAPRVEAPLFAWIEMVERIREGEDVGFARAWSLELLARATGRDDCARIVLAKDGRAAGEIVAELFERRV